MLSSHSVGHIYLPGTSKGRIKRPLIGSRLVTRTIDPPQHWHGPSSSGARPGWPGLGRERLCEEKHLAGTGGKSGGLFSRLPSLPAFLERWQWRELSRAAKSSPFFPREMFLLVFTVYCCSCHVCLLSTLLLSVGDTVCPACVRNLSFWVRIPFVYAACGSAC